MHQYTDVVIGSSLSAVLFAFQNQYPIFFTQPRRPFRFDYLESDMDLSFLKIPTEVKTLKTFVGDKKVGIAKELLWERLLFLLSLEGNAPLSNLCSTLRYDGETITCSNDYSKIFQFEFKACHYFGDTNALNFTKQEKELDDDTYICYDYIAFNKGGKHEIDYIHTGDDFVSEIWFYSSDRIDGNTPIRDACAVSLLTEEQLLDFDYSQTMARFKVIHEMESRGMKGTFAHDYTTAGNPKHYKFRTTSIHRETNKQGHEPRPSSSDIKIPEANEKDLLKNLPSAVMAYDRFLRYW